MAIRKSKVTYVTDTGREMEVGDMTASHLMNAIAHHKKQYDAIERELDGRDSDFPMITLRMSALGETIDTLFAELATRDPAKDDEKQEDSRPSSFRSYSGY